MAELDEISDRITILRDGEYITTVETPKTTHDELIAFMVGRQIEDLYSKHNHATDEILLRVEGLASGKEVKNASFDLRRGEVLGFSGLVGSGRTETMCTLFGLRKREAGKVWLEGGELHLRNVKDAVNAGMGLVPEDRKKEGIFPVQSILYNTTITIIKRFLRYGRHRASKEMEPGRRS